MRDLSRLFRPRSVAVFGGNWARTVIRQCLKMGYDGDIWPVHPTRSEIAGLKCYASVADLPEAPDAAFVGVNRHATVDVVGALADRGAGGAACFAAGFTEAGDASLQDALVAAAGEMPVLGPNCYGIINYLDGVPLWPDQQGGVRVARGVGVISQSSNVANNITMQTRGLPLAYVACVGNQAQTGTAEMAVAMLEDTRVSAVGFYIEGIVDATAFAEMTARARELGKPLVAIKAGKTEMGRAAAASHTAALAGEAAVSSAFLRRCGVVEVDDLPELLEALKLMHVAGPMKGRRLGSMSCSGGEAALVADLSADLGLEFPQPQTAGEIRAILGPIPTVTNPLDYHTFIWGDEEPLRATFSAMLRGGYDLGLLVLDFPRADRCDSAEWDAVLGAIVAARTETGVPTVVASTLPENMPEGRAQDLMARGVVPMSGLAVALRSIAACMAVGAVKPFRPLGVGAADDMRQLDEAEAKALLDTAGIAVPCGVSGDRDAVVAGATGLGGPLVLKGLGFAHKSEAGAVKLGLEAAEVGGVADRMSGASRFLVEEMVIGGVAELLVGLRRDPIYGASLTVGMGGVEAELLADVRTLVLPVSAGDISGALHALRLAPLLNGYRGRAKADVPAAVATIVALTEMFRTRPEIVEIEINPLILRAQGSGVVAVDALISLGENHDG